MDRRRFLSVTPAVLGTTRLRAAAPAPVLRRRIPQLAEPVPVIGMGTWLTFDAGDDAGEAAQRREVLQRFFAAGGGLIDSSPMYGRAERLLGELLTSLPHDGRLVTATKVWTPLDVLGPVQFDDSLKLWRVPRFDVLLVHNLLNWRGHLKRLRQWKEQGRVRAIGVSTSHGHKHDEAERVLRDEPLDVLQITYNLADTRAERLMNLAAERGLAVVINRPFDGGDLFGRVAGRSLPPWAGDIDCANWAQFFLKWVVSHPAVTCAIPATRQPPHMDQNMGAGQGGLPDAAMRRRMQGHLERG
ncbi:MAG TPA: aldo/keto reductase [Albitalea sp.]|nr:aldo/keto reductase [Albitalea sp.]